MHVKVSPVKYIVYFILISLLSLILSISFADYLYLKVDTRVLLGVISGLNIIMYIMYLYPVVAISIGVFTGIFALILFAMYRAAFLAHLSSAWMYISDAAAWFMDYVYGNGQINKSYGFFIVAAVAALIAIVFFLLIIYRHLSLITLAAGIAILSNLWFLGYDVAIKRLWQYCIVGFILYGYANYDIIENKWRTKHDKYSKIMMLPWLGYTMVIVITSYLLINVLPTRIKPVNNEWLNDNVFDRIANYNPSETFSRFNYGRDDSRFSISTLGFQDSPTRLGGSVSVSNKLLLKVKLDGTTISPIYLRGTVKDIYTGSMWDKTKDTSVNVKDNEPARVDLGNDDNVMEHDEVNITVYPQALSTTSIFNIWKPYSADVPTSEYLSDTGGEFFFSKSQGKKEYKVESRVPRIYADELRSAPSGSYSARGGIIKYMQLPETITSRVRALSYQITDGYGNNYDKAVAIQNYLRENYPYTLDTSQLPEGRDFVDYFLFDEKKGYCTYFASAMVVMCRINSIPARYVEGFVLDSSDTGSDGLYDVYSKKAHAWVEVYFDGYGWVTFEPTASFEGYDYDRPDNPETSPTTTPGTSATPTTSAPTKNPDQEDEGDVPVVGPNGENRRALPLYAIALLILAAAIILRGALKYYMDFRRIKNADRSNGREAAMEYMEVFERKLKLGGVRREAGETAAEFGHRVNDEMSEYDIDMESLMKLFGEVRFGNRPVDKDVRSSFKEAFCKADIFVRKRKGIIKYLVFKFII